MRGIHRQHGDRISLLLFFQNKESGLKTGKEMRVGGERKGKKKISVIKGKREGKRKRKGGRKKLIEKLRTEDTKKREFQNERKASPYHRQ
jgi:hypothetical protein